MITDTENLQVILYATLVVVSLSIVLSGSIILVRKILIPDKPIEIEMSNHATIEGRFGEKLLQSLHDHNILIPSACAGGGTCGLCRIRVLQGGGPASATESALLGQHAIGEGYHLACQMTLRDRIKITLPDSVSRTARWQATVESSRAISPLIREIRFALPDDQPLNFQAGDFIQLSATPGKVDLSKIEVDDAHLQSWKSLDVDKLSVVLTETETRAYSLANSPGEHQHVTLLVRLATPPAGKPSIPPGKVSSWLFTRKPGDTVEITGPYGDFHLDETDNEIVLIGGGVGLAPLKAMVLAEHDRQSSRRVSLWYGTRSKHDLMYTDEFDELTKKMHDFQWHVALSEPLPEDNWEGAQGFVHETLEKDFLRKHTSPSTCRYYLCGPPLMISAVKNSLTEAGVPDEHIFYDDFG